MTNASLPPADGPRSMFAARIAVGSAVAVALIVTALHAVRPEFGPSWRFISEYAIGGLGWIMKLAFLIWAVGCLALALALWREVTAWPGKLGVAVLWLVAFALVPAGLFAMDPVTAKPEEVTTSGMIHAISSMIGVPGIPIAAMLISSSLWRTNPAWTPRRFAIMATAHATWVSFFAMNVYVAWVLSTSGGFNSEHWAGWLNRLVVATYIAWQLVVGCLLLMNRRGR